MAKVYGGIEGIRKPEFDDFRAGEGYGIDWDKYHQAEEAYIEQIKEYARKHGKGALRGKELAISHADGAARYIVLEGSKLIHLAVGDAWDAPLAHYITAKGIKEYITRNEGIEAIFAKHRGS